MASDLPYSGEVSSRYPLTYAAPDAADSPLRRAVFVPRYPTNPHMQIPDHVITKSGPAAGPTVAIFGGVHGNERAGILTVGRLAATLAPIAGTVHLVYANPPAISKNVRQVDANLNRLFARKGEAPSLYEHRRAAELMGLLDGCDALLDLHSYPSPMSPETAIPFAICEAEHRPIAALFDVPMVVSGFTAAEEGGSDGYMHLRGKTGICVELGANELPEPAVDLGMDTALKFLAHFGCIGPAPVSPKPQRHLTLTTFYKKSAADFKFARPFRTFDRLAAGDPIAADAGLSLVADKDAYIIFPNDTRPVGVEAFLLARE
ncbi:MAG: hypothetical protein RL272_943 [Candidatus Parcubacteria bacterium]|jgi:predicted deacylase